ncbi:MAG TPA: cytochrome c [Longimicrobiaceae bacterium]|nr:cytochrome c [Longimicrobiaceae bacterium]
MRKWLRRLGYAAGGLLGVVLVAAAAVYAASELRIRRTFAISGQKLAVSSDPATVERGRHLATAIGKCVECHGADLGGKSFIDAPPIGVLYASNLTGGRGGALPRYSDEQLERAIRNGVGAGGHALKVMPSQDYHVMSDADVSAIIAYLRSLPPVDKELPAATLGPLGRLLYLKGDLPLLSVEDKSAWDQRQPVKAGPTVEYGRYLATVGGCRGCHNPSVSGGPIPGTPPEFPPAQNLTPDTVSGIGKWSEADFTRALRQGRRPDGSQLNDAMPWKLAGQMTDEEMHAVWLYLRSVPPRAYAQN